MSAPTVLDDYLTLSNGIRLVGVFLGFALALVYLKGAYLAFRAPRDLERGMSDVAFALLAISPAIPWLYRFDEPLFVPSMVTYMLALGFALVAVTYRMRLRWKWWRRLMTRLHPNGEDEQ